MYKNLYIYKPHGSWDKQTIRLDDGPYFYVVMTIILPLPPETEAPFSTLSEIYFVLLMIFVFMLVQHQAVFLFDCVSSLKTIWEVNRSEFQFIQIF